MKISENPLVSIITVNYNGTEVTMDFLKSLKAITYKNVEVIIVDNASKEVPVDKFKELYPEVKMVLSEKNLGFAGGNNLGVDKASGELLFFVNNDTEFTPNILEGMVETFHQHPDAGAVSPKFHYFFHPNTIEYAGYEKVNPFTGRNVMIGCQEKDNGQHDNLAETHYAHGGGMMIPMHVIAKVGKMSEVFFLYYEEFDWCEMIKRGGFRIYYQPKSLIYHKESMTVGKANPMKTYYLSRNRILFMRRNVKGFRILPFLFYLTFVTVPKNLLTHLVKREFEHLRAFTKGITWNLKNLNLKN